MRTEMEGEGKVLTATEEGGGVLTVRNTLERRRNMSAVVLYIHSIN